VDAVGDCDGDDVGDVLSPAAGDVVGDWVVPAVGDVVVRAVRDDDAVGERGRRRCCPRS
jgi:hypothetical protein